MAQCTSDVFEAEIALWGLEMIFRGNTLARELIPLLTLFCAVNSWAQQAESGRTVTPFVVPPGEGDQIWFLGQLGTIKLSVEETGATYGAILITAAAGYAPNAHTHLREDESFYLLEGALRFFAGEREFDVQPGTFVFSPKGIPHRFVVTGDGPARWLLFHGPTGDFRRFIKEVGTQADSPAWPPRALIPDPAAVPAIARKHFIEPSPQAVER